MEQQNDTHIFLPISATPYQHQREAFSFVFKLFSVNSGESHRKGAALLMEMGTGKTLTTIAIAGKLRAAGSVQKALIVAPLSIVGVWREEFEKFAAYPYNLTVLEGSLQKKTATLAAMKGSSLQAAVLNYESAWRMEKELLAWNADLIVADEAHKIKNHSTRVSKALHRLGAKARYKLLLTGTVITNKALDVFSQYKFIDPGIFGSSFYSFRNRYFDMVGYGGYTPVLKRHMEPELVAKMHSVAFRATKAECLDLPETVDILRTVVLEPSAARLYRDLAKDSYAELGKGEITAPNVLTRLLRLSQLTGGYIGNDDGKVQMVSRAKMDMLEDIIDSAVSENQKIVVIARFVPEINAICKMLEKKDISYACISGGVTDRDAQVSRFQNDPETKVFVGQIATAGLGITLTAASTMVFYSVDYSMSNFEQAKARIHRVGQAQKCTYLYLVASGTVDEKVFMALRSKADLARVLVDDCRRGLNPYT